MAGTACTYFRRFYLKRDLCEFDPRLVGPACLFLACKTEECQVQAKILYHFMRKLNATGALHVIPNVCPHYWPISMQEVVYSLLPIAFSSECASLPCSQVPCHSNPGRPSAARP